MTHAHGMAQKHVRRAVTVLRGAHALSPVSFLQALSLAESWQRLLPTATGAKGPRVQRASRACNMASDEHLAGGVEAAEQVTEV
jgi:hypothetical protein